MRSVNTSLGLNGSNHNEYFVSAQAGKYKIKFGFMWKTNLQNVFIFSYDATDSWEPNGAEYRCRVVGRY